MIAFHRRTAWRIAICAVASLVAIGTVLLFVKQRDSHASDADSTSDSSTANHPQEVPLLPESESSMDKVAVEGETGVDPRVACHDPLGELSEECLQSLDAYFMDKPFAWKEFDWLLEPMTYRRIFADPGGDGEKVLAALESPECRLEEGGIRWDLRESCHAESFANYANVLKFCRDPINDFEVSSDDSLGLTEREISEARWIKYEDYEYWVLHGEYEMHSTWAGEKLLEMRWLAERACSQHDVRTLTWHDITENNLFEILEPIGKKLELSSGKYDSSAMAAFFKQFTGDSSRSFWSEDAVDVLRALAARLGDEWAASVYESTVEDEEWKDHEEETMPWKKYLEIMRSAMNYRRSPPVDASKWVTFRNAYRGHVREIAAMGDNYLRIGSEERTSVLAFALGAWGELDKADMEIDLDRLVEYVCGPNWRNATETCQEAIARLNATETSTDQRYWHRLSQFEDRAIELGLYDVEPSHRDPDWERKELGVAELMDVDE